MNPHDEGADTRAVDPVRVGGDRSLAQFSCERCGATVEFAPGTTVLRCPYCEHENQIPAHKDEPGAVTVAEVDLRATLEGLRHQSESVQVPSIECGACKAIFLPAPGVSATACPFCGTNLVMTAHSATVIKPKSLLPFGLGRDAAMEKYRAWLRSRWFAPNRLRSQSMLDAAFSGMYLPAWTYDAKTVTKYTGQRGDAYYVTVGSGKNRRTERRIRWSNRSGIVRDTFDDVLIMATTTLPAKHLAALEPWDLANLVPYADAYLAGFGAEVYSIDLPQGFAQAQVIMAEGIRDSIRSDIGGDEQRISSMDVAWNDLTFKHLLLPVWISAYRFRGRSYQVLVNARTGEVRGDRPYSWLKITLAVLAGLTLIAIVALIVSRAQ